MHSCPPVLHKTQPSTDLQRTPGPTLRTLTFSKPINSATPGGTVTFDTVWTIVLPLTSPNWRVRKNSRTGCIGHASPTAVLPQTEIPDTTSGGE